MTYLSINCKLKVQYCIAVANILITLLQICLTMCVLALYHSNNLPFEYIH